MTAIKNIIIQTKKIIHNNTQKIKTKTQKLKKSMINNSHKFRHSVTLNLGAIKEHGDEVQK